MRDHLGAATALIDIFVAPAPQELEIVAGFSIYQTACNWKIMHENGPDAYHAPVVHNNFAQAVNFREKREVRSGVAKTDTGRLTGRIESASYDLGNGHTAFWHKRPDPEAFPIYAQKAELEKQFTPGQLEWILGRGRHMTIFPNLLLNDLASTHLRCYRPLSVDRMETMIWCIAPVGEPAEMRAARLRKFEDFFLPSGMATPDDVAVAESAQKASFAFNSKWTSMGRGSEFRDRWSRRRRARARHDAAGLQQQLGSRDRDAGRLPALARDDGARRGAASWLNRFDGSGRGIPLPRSPPARRPQVRRMARSVLRGCRVLGAGRRHGRRLHHRPGI